MLLFVGRLQALKGVDLALETLIELRARGRNAMWRLSGDPRTGRSIDARPAPPPGRGGGRDRTRQFRRTPVAPTAFDVDACVRRRARAQPLREFRLVALSPRPAARRSWRVTSVA